MFGARGRIFPSGVSAHAHHRRARRPGGADAGGRGIRLPPHRFTGGYFEAWLSRLAEPQPDLRDDENLHNQAWFVRLTEILREVLVRRQNEVMPSAPPGARPVPPPARRAVTIASATSRAAPRAEFVAPRRSRVPTITGAAVGELTVAISAFSPFTPE